jgi:hypothetical protein
LQSEWNYLQRSASRFVPAPSIFHRIAGGIFIFCAYHRQKSGNFRLANIHVGQLSRKETSPYGALRRERARGFQDDRVALRIASLKAIEAAILKADSLDSS